MASAGDREKASFAVVVDTFEETTARILGGYNLSTDTDNAHRPLTKVVATGWTNAAADRLASNTLTCGVWLVWEARQREGCVHALVEL